ncbi:FAD dependent oxidoreductase [Cystobasidium minutum MCA 4210]|uniref:FAD dependent oxidoreductase n=1 Tax=Cystobasidium minutum MCA 4210 TaxID=1397322 RepID=UPI0034CF56BB|eukprot:jgi/Rhomi1/107070/CE107069_359
MEVPMPTQAEVDSYFPSHPSPAPLPVSNPTRSFWLYSDPDCNPLGDHGSTSVLPDSVDILIIGSGISGISTLYHLVQSLRNTSRSVTKIAVMEARQFCSGAAGRNGGHCTCYCPVDFAAMEAHDGREDALKHVKLEQRTVDSILDLIQKNGWADDVDLTQAGNIHLIRSQEERLVIESNLKAAEIAGIDISAFKFLSEAECAQLVGSKGDLSGLQLPGNNLYPLKFVTKLFELARRQAAEIGVEVQLYTHTPVTAIEALSPGSWSVRTSRGSVRTRGVVHATNAYASHLLPSLLKTSRPVVPCRAQVMAIRPKDSKKFWDTGFSYNEGFEYFFQRPDRKANGQAAVPYIILGGGRSVAPAPHELGVADDSELNPTVSAYLKSFLPTHFPSLSATEEKQEIDFHWTGIMGFTPSRNPIVGPVYIDGAQQQGQYILAGFSGHGVSRAGACAEAVAGMLLAELEGRATPKYSWMPSHFLTKP